MFVINSCNDHHYFKKNKLNVNNTIKKPFINNAVHASLCGVKSCELLPLTVILFFIKIKMYD